MNENIKENYRFAVIRGATTSTGNSVQEIKDAVTELIEELISRNNLIPTKIISITFTVTKDLDACFPASVAREYYGLDKVAFLDCQQMFVPHDIDFCIRLMAQVSMPSTSCENHPYLHGAARLRSDRC